MRKMCWYIDIQ